MTYLLIPLHAVLLVQVFFYAVKDSERPSIWWVSVFCVGMILWSDLIIYSLEKQLEQRPPAGAVQECKA